MYFGIGKVIEECGELLQTLGKLIPFPVERHPDNDGDLRQRIMEEIADVRAATTYFAAENFTPEEVEYIHARSIEKISKFRKWGLTGIPAQPVEKA